MVAAGTGGTATTGGFAITGPAGGLLAIAGVCCCGTTCCTACLGCGTIRRGAATGALGAGVATMGATAGFAVSTAVPGPAFAAVAALTTAGRAAAGGGVLLNSASACLRARIAFSASPGFEARDRSMPRPVLAAVALFAAPPGLRPVVRYSRTFTASSASMELECVFVSVTPTAVRASRISLLFTSSSRARSLIRTLLIRLFSLPLPLAVHVSLIEEGICFPSYYPRNRTNSNHSLRSHCLPPCAKCRVLRGLHAPVTLFLLFIDPLRCDLFALVHQRVHRIVLQFDLLLARIRIAQRVRIRLRVFARLDILG